MVTVEFAFGVEVMVAILRMHVPDPSTDPGVKLDVALSGSPVAFKTIGLAKPAVAPITTLNVVLPPLPAVCLEGVAEIEKSAITESSSAPPLQEDNAGITSKHDRKKPSRIFDLPSLLVRRSELAAMPVFVAKIDRCVLQSHL